MDLEIRPLDERSDADLAAANALEEAYDHALYGASQRLTLTQRRALLADSPYWHTRRWLARERRSDGLGPVVGEAVLFLPQQDNLDTIDVGLMVHPDARGRGVATALVEQVLVPQIEAHGRDLVSYWEAAPAQGDVDDPALPANRLARRLGVTRKNVGVCRVLPLPVEEDLLDRLRDEARERMDGYRILLWTDRVPSEHLAAYGVLLRQLDLDEPDEDFEYDPPEYTPERIQTMEQRRAEAGTRSLTAVAVAPDGTFAGNSEVHVQDTAGTQLAWQENTLVMPEHRGHRLGLALKEATHRLLQAEFPEVRAIVTSNSHVNPWMIAINERLGYREAFRWVGYQGRWSQRAAASKASEPTGDSEVAGTG